MTKMERVRFHRIAMYDHRERETSFVRVPGSKLWRATKLEGERPKNPSDYEYTMLGILRTVWRALRMG